MLRNYIHTLEAPTLGSLDYYKPSCYSFSPLQKKLN